eukprot:UN25017
MNLTKTLCADSTIKNRTGNITVALIRLITNTWGQPDTQALACLGAFGNSGQAAPLYDVTSSSGAVVIENKIFEILSHTGAESSIQINSVQGLRLFPSENPKKSLKVVPGESFVLTGDDTKEINMGGKTLPVEHLGELEHENQITQFLRDLETNLKMWKVTAARPNDLSECLRWTKQLSGTVKLSSNSVFTSIAQLEQNVIGQMNSNQLADYLRGAHSGVKRKEIPKEKSQILLQKGL